MLNRDAKCQACPMFRGCKSPGMILSGTPGGILIVGLYPGYFEDLKGDLFCGKSGRQLRFYANRICSPVQIPVAYTNLVGCKLAPGAKLDTKNVATCWSLHSRFSAGRPRLILAAGDGVVRFLLGDPKLRVSRMRGRTFYYDGDIPLIVCNNPAKAEYEKSRATYNAIQEDLRRAVTVLQNPEPKTVHFVENPGPLDSQDTLVIDLETTGLDVHRDKPVLGGVATLEKPEEVYFYNDFREIPVPRRVVGWNFSFDSQWLDPIFASQPEWIDGMLLHGLLHPDATGRSLKVVGPQYTGVEYQETLDDFSSVEDGPRLRQYLATDLFQTGRTVEALLRELESHPAKRLFPWLMRLAKTTARWTRFGVHLDRKEIDRLCTELLDSQRQSINAMQRIAQAYNLSIGGKQNGWTFSRSTKAIQKLLFEYLALPVTLTEKGNPSLDEETRARLEPLDPTGFVKHLGHFMADQKLVSTYVTPYIEEDWLDGQDCLHPTPYLVQRTKEALRGSESQGGGTITGRVVWSHRLQLLPPRIRPIIRTRFPGGCIFSVDLAQIEPRVLAWLSGEPVLIDTFLRREDIYTTYMTIALGCERSEVTREIRNVGKTIVLAILYGAGPPKIQEVFKAGIGKHLPLAECEGILKRLTRGLPRVMEWKDRIIERLENHLPVITSTGASRLFPIIPEDEHIRQAINFPVQRFASEINHALCMEADATLPLDHGMFTVHDSYVGDSEKHEGCEERIRGVWSRAREIIKRDFGLDFSVPIEFEIKTGERWS